MSGWFIFALIALAAISGVGYLIHRGFYNADDVDAKPYWTAVAGAVVFVVLTLISSANIVGTRSVGVSVAFGKPDDKPLGNGLHWVAPWKSVEVFDASVKTLKLDRASGKSENGDLGDCVTVRLANQTTACVDVSIQWQINSAGDVVELYRQYRTFDNVQNNLVERQLVNVLKDVFEPYNPLATINGTNDNKLGSLDSMARDAQTRLSAALGTGIKVQNTVITFVHYDDVTQAKLNAYAQAVADTRIAEQREETAKATKRANDQLASGASSNSPGVLYQNCLDMVERLTKEGKGLPPAFSCGAPPATVVPVK